MNTQQRRPFFLTATPIQGRRRGCRLAVTLSAALLCSCANLTPEQNAILVQLAANAAQIGLQLLLEKHPHERARVVAVVDSMNGLTAVGPITSKQTAALLQGLPDDALKGDRAELYRSGKRLVIYDNLRGKAFTVPDGLAGEAVARAIRQGMQRALEPLPPAIPPRPVRHAVREQPPTIVYVTNQTVILVPEAARQDGLDSVLLQDVARYFETHPQARFVRTNSPYTLELRNGPHTNSSPISSQLVVPSVVQSPTPGTAAAKFSKGPRVGIYRVERREGTNWVEVQSFTDVPVGEWRVRRIR